MTPKRWLPAAGIAGSAAALVLVPLVTGTTSAQPVDSPASTSPVTANSPDTTVPAQPQTSQPAPIPTLPAADDAITRFLPVQLEVPRLGVSAPIDATGVAQDGQAEVPENAARVGWYRFGPAPGEAGATVIVGHVDSRKYGKGALYPLREARVGDEVLMNVDSGEQMSYEIVDVTRYDKVTLPAEQLFKRTGDPVLHIITCGGPYVPSLGGYQQNLVVTAVPVEA
jgi:sortase (surface protein transpeptidase)